ncbi:Holliday junction branch migration protein RuvA [Spirulina major]|uniref:Holliday junction branch migration protein RuvA n=1 Tax=Spirulina major TaxID=270636 RepID=UPI0009351975|nr:Holliday junction branch migration protein RuvA [Spirulina major]
MISYLNGQVVAVQRRNQRLVAIVEVNQIGYEVQIPGRWATQLPTGTGEMLQIFTHHQTREDQTLLYGFASMAERDLFRQLIAVSGIGAQLAIALLDALGLEELVQAIVTNNTRVLIKTPGVGKKTAERIALELKTSLAQWRTTAQIAPPATANLDPTLQEDVELTLLALGYDQDEITSALIHLHQDPQLLKTPAPELWIKAAIAWLSQG